MVILWIWHPKVMRVIDKNVNVTNFAGQYWNIQLLILWYILMDLDHKNRIKGMKKSLSDKKIIKQMK